MVNARAPVSNSKTITVTVGREQDKQENTVAAVPIGQIPAAQQLHEHVPGHSANERGSKVKEVT